MDSPKEIAQKKEPSKHVEGRRDERMPETAFSIYANDVRVQTSPWDMKLRFGEVLPEQSDETRGLRVNVFGDIKISLPLAKRLAAIMLAQIQTYEKSVGEIPLPKD